MRTILIWPQNGTEYKTNPSPSNKNNNNSITSTNHRNVKKAKRPRNSLSNKNHKQFVRDLWYIFSSFAYLVFLFSIGNDPVFSIVSSNGNKGTAVAPKGYFFHSIHFLFSFSFNSLANNETPTLFTHLRFDRFIRGYRFTLTKYFYCVFWVMSSDLISYPSPSLPPMYARHNVHFIFHNIHHFYFFVRFGCCVFASLYICFGVFTLYECVYVYGIINAVLLVHWNLPFFSLPFSIRRHRVNLPATCNDILHHFRRLVCFRGCRWAQWWSK